MADQPPITLTPEWLLRLYAHGYFPMAETEADPHVAIIAPRIRGILPIFNLHVPRRLARTIRSTPHRVTVNRAFADVIDACASTRTPSRRESWINAEIKDVYNEAHLLGFAHSIEVWNANNRLIGGLYGIAIGQVFCGESMFSHARDVSKVALVHLCARLWAGGYQMLDAQFPNSHLAQFGMEEIGQDEYVARIQPLLSARADFWCAGRGQAEILAAYFAARRGATVIDSRDEPPRPDIVP